MLVRFCLRVATWVMILSAPWGASARCIVDFARPESDHGDGAPPLLQTPWGPRPAAFDDTPLASEVMGDGATPTPPQALVDNLRLRVSKSPTAIGWYLLGRALTLSTSAGADYHTLVLGKLPGPRFDRPLTDDDARLLGEAHHALGLAREQLGAGGEPMPVRAGISLAWVMELEAVAPGGDPASAVSALQLYLSCAEAAFDSQGADSPEFIEAMASGQHAYDALPFWRRWAQFDARSRMTGLNSKSAAARQKSVDDIAALKQRHEELCRRTPLVISLDGSLDPLEFSDDQAVVSFALDHQIEHLFRDLNTLGIAIGPEASGGGKGMAAVRGTQVVVSYRLP